MVRCAFEPIRFQDSLIISISGRDQLIPLSDHCEYFLFISLYLIKCIGDSFSYDLFFLTLRAGISYQFYVQICSFISLLKTVK